MDMSAAQPTGGVQLRGLRLGPLALEAPTALAPMAALTDSVFRRMIKRQGGCGFVVSEMVPAEALVRGCPRARELLAYAEEERPIGGQIMGARAESMSDAARIIESLGFDFVDINMGCPARKVVHGGGGSAMMRDLPNTARTLDAVRRAVSIPLTVKLRAGWSESCVNAPEVARIAEDCGAAMVTLHARTRADGYRAGVRDDVLVRTRAAVSVPVIANGDIRSPERAREVVGATGCDGVMAGRGAVANPWLLSAIASGEHTKPCGERARRWILDHFAVLSEELDRRRLMSKLKTFSGWYTRGLMDGARLRREISRLDAPEQFIAAVEEFFAAYDGRAPAAGGLTPAHQGGRP